MRAPGRFPACFAQSGTKLRRTFSFFGNLPTADDGDGYPRHLVPPAHMIEGPNRAAWAAFKLLDVDKVRAPLSAVSSAPKCLAAKRRELRKSLG